MSKDGSNQRFVSGINIQFPISRLLISGRKTVETRTYAIPQKYLGVDLAFVETPGKSGKFEARIVGTIRFSECFRYANESDFYRDKSRHMVEKKSPWAWSNSKPKWGWIVEAVSLFPEPLPAPARKGIRFTLGIKISGYATLSSSSSISSESLNAANFDS